MKATFQIRTNGEGDKYSVESQTNPTKPRTVYLSTCVTCNCPHFLFKLGAGGAVSASDTTRQCKHITAALLEQGIRAALQIVPVHDCLICHKPGAELPCCNDQYAHETIGFIHSGCFHIAAIKRMHGNDCPSDFLASHGPTDAEKQAETEYFAQERKRDAYADNVESPVHPYDLNEEMEDDYSPDEPEPICNDLYGGLRRERVWA